jgi:hypothetical protein
LPTDQFERLRNGDYVVDPGRNRKRLDFMAPASASDGGDNSALRTARDVGLKAGFTDALNDVFDLLGGGVIRHVHDHGCYLSDVLPEKQKAAMLSRLGWNLELSCFSLKSAPILYLRRKRKWKAAKVAEGIKSCHGLSASNSI